MDSSSRRYLNMPGGREPSAADQVVDIAALTTIPGMPSWGERVGQRLRMATERPLETMGLAKDGRLRVGRVAGLGSLLTLLAAANELNDPNESAGRNLAQAAGTGVGGIGGGGGGALLGGLLTGGNPLGVLVGSAIGSALGGTAGKGLATVVADVAEGSPDSRAIDNLRKQGQAALDLEVERANRLMPIQNQAAQLALQNEAVRQEMLNDQMLRQAMAQGLLAQQQAGAAQQVALTNAILGA